MRSAVVKLTRAVSERFFEPAWSINEMFSSAGRKHRAAIKVIECVGELSPG